MSAEALSASKSRGSSEQEPEINKLFRLQIKHAASDLHLQTNKPAMLRIRGQIRELQMPPISEEEMWSMFQEMMDLRNKRIMEENGGCDFAHLVPEDGKVWRFRVNLFKQLGMPGLVARKVERSIPDVRGIVSAPDHGGAVQVRPGNGAAGGRHGLRKIDHDRVHAELDQSELSQAHSDDRRPDRVRLHAGQVPDQPAGGRHGRRWTSDIAMKHAVPRRSGRHAGGRNARHGDVRNGHPRRRNRAPGVRDDSRVQRPGTISRILDLFPQDRCTAPSGPACP